MKRRDFLIGLTGTAAWAAEPKPSLCVFSKMFAPLSVEDLARTAKAMGYLGIDLTVRKEQGHVQPENVARDLPYACDVIRALGLEVTKITTDLLSAEDPRARAILETAGRMKIPAMNPGYWLYNDKESTETTLEKAKAGWRGLAKMAELNGVVMGLHNHSLNRVGASGWDLREILAGTNTKWIGYYYDPGHATIEGGGYNWELALRMMLPRLKMISVKDFYWDQKPGKATRKWCPMGQGNVDFKKFWAMVKDAKFTGPVSVQVEYKPEEFGMKDYREAFTRDLAFTKKFV